MSENDDKPKGAHGSVENPNQCDDIKKLRVEFNDLKEQHSKLVEIVASQGTELKGILEFQGGTRVYVAEIKDQLDRMEDRLFKFMNDLVTSLTQKEAALAATEAKKEEVTAAAKTKENTHKWDKLLDTIKAIFQIAVGAAVGFFLSDKK